MVKKRKSKYTRRCTASWVVEVLSHLQKSTALSWQFPTSNLTYGRSWCPFLESECDGTSMWSSRQYQLGVTSRRSWFRSTRIMPRRWTQLWTLHPSLWLVQISVIQPWANQVQNSKYHKLHKNSSICFHRQTCSLKLKAGMIIVLINANKMNLSHLSHHNQHMQVLSTFK